MDQADLIPEVLDQLPDKILYVKYQGIHLTPGDVLEPKKVKLMPDLEWLDDRDALYTICMIDPDAPSKNDPKFREFLHWLVVNVPMNNIKKGETIAEYIGAGPPKDTGLHRYLILLFKQYDKIQWDESKITSKTLFRRHKFSNKAFARKYHFQALVAANMFFSEWDDYVPKLYRKMDFCAFT